MTTTIVGPDTFNLLFYLLVFFAGLDFASSGHLVLRYRLNDIRAKKLLGLWIIRRLHNPNNEKKNSNAYLRFIYDIRNMGIMAFVGGILIIFGSGIMIIDIFLG